MIDIAHLHPMIVHFPIALVIAGFIADIAGFALKKEFFNKMASYIVIAGALGVIAAYLSGDAAGDNIEEIGALGATLELHEEAAKVAMIISAIAGSMKLGQLLIKKYETVLKYTSAVVVMAAVAAISVTGFYGGELVYKHAAGVQITISTQKDVINTENSKETNKAGDED